MFCIINNLCSIQSILEFVNLWYIGWLLDPEARPTFEELESRMNEFLSDPLRYILTVVSIHVLRYYVPMFCCCVLD